MKYTTVLWDFNGTVVNDVHIGIRAINKMLEKRNLKTIDSVEAYHRVFRFPVKEYYRLVGFDFETEPYEDLAVEWVKNFTADEISLKLNDGFLEVWEHLNATGVKQMILSSSETEMLNRQIALLGLSHKFDEILGTGDIFAGGKIEMARKCLGTEVKNTVLIGDTPHDADTAKAICADCILYAGGHASFASLSRRGFRTVRHLSELIPLLT